MKVGIEDLKLHLSAKHCPKEYKVDKRTRFVVVEVAKLQSEVKYLDHGNLQAYCKHTPRFWGDSHSSIFPTPAVADWPEEVQEAYHFAFSKLLADCSESTVYS